MPTERNVSDTRNYSRFYRQRLRAEVLLDAITDITEVSDSFSAMPPQSRANQIWTTRVSSLFLDTFGRPNPNQDPPCERMPESTVVQTLHLMNAPNLHNKLTTDAGFVARMAASQLPSEKIVEVTDGSLSSESKFLTIQICMMFIIIQPRICLLYTSPSPRD